MESPSKGNPLILYEVPLGERERIFIAWGYCLPRGGAQRDHKEKKEASANSQGNYSFKPENYEKRLSGP